MHGGAAVWAQTKALIPGLLVGLMWAVVLAAVSLFLASLSGRRAFATGAVAIFFLLTYTLARSSLQVETRLQAGPVGAGPSALAAPVPSLAEKIAGLFSPFTLFDGVRRWLGGRGAEPGDKVPHPGAFGVVYALVLLVLLAACLAGAGRPLPEGASVMSVIELSQRQPLVRQRGGGQRHHDVHRPRRHRAARPERRGQVHDLAHDRRVPRPVARAR